MGLSAQSALRYPLCWQKTKIIDSLAEQLSGNSNFYLADISNLTSDKTSELRRKCFNKGISIQVVKNSLLKKAMERNAQYQQIIPTLKGATSLMFCTSGSEPAKVIKDFRKSNDRPLLKAAFIEESVYIGDSQLDFLVSIKSKKLK